MNRSTIKYSISRKPLHYLSKAHRRRLMTAIKVNLNQKHDHSNSTEKTREIVPSSSSAEYNDDLITDSIHIDNMHMVEEDCCSNSSTFSESSGNNELNFDLQEPVSSFSFQKRLAACFIDNKLNHVQINSILSLLRTHACFSNLPKDVRTLLKTPRDPISISCVQPGEYIHFDLEEKLIHYLKTLENIKLNRLDLDIHTDGCNLDHSGAIHLWPIQVKVANIESAKPIIVGIYKGAEKPNNPNTFFDKFVTDVANLISKNGITFNNIKIPIHLRCFIADAPARAFILNHRGHNSLKPCSKCKVVGVRFEGRSVFNTIHSSNRVDNDYPRCLDSDHHKDGKSPLSNLPIGMVSQVPFEYMHLVCLGVVKKILMAWVQGKYSRLSKLSNRCISNISNRLEILKTYCPSDFARPPRSLQFFSKYKATEFRQFLLYTGPVVTYGLMDNQIYQHFLFLHAAIRVLVSPTSSSFMLNFAELSLQKFVQKCYHLYGPSFSTYNVHGLLHLTEDVRHLGNLDSFSAFPFENNMRIFRQICRKPGLPLQQFYNRMKEIELNTIPNNKPHDISIPKFVEYPATAKRSRFCKIEYSNFIISTETCDNCLLLQDGSICIVCDIINSEDSYILCVKKFLCREDFYDIGIASSDINIYKCFTLDHQILSIRLGDISSKCYRMPLFSNVAEENSSDSEDDNLQFSTFVSYQILITTYYTCQICG
ncbi:uncharacterized protein [Prorops nasuta]|uniref:uncharacterized protein n=1 Tax=Prorops nasuta TaxID=863751 RepID=UPI0034CE26CF